MCRRFPALLFGLLLLSPVLRLDAQKDQLFTATREQLDVTKVVLEQQNAWNAGDLDRFVSLYKDAPDTIALLPSVVRGLEAIRNAFHTNFPSKGAMGTLEQTDVEVREMGEKFALAVGKYHLTRSKKDGGNVDGMFSEVLEKTDAGWRVIYSSNT